MSAICLVLIAFQHFNIASSMWNAVSILYTCGFLFTLNGQYQDLCKAKGFARASRVFAVLMYLATVAILVLLLLDRFLVINI